MPAFTVNHNEIIVIKPFFYYLFDGTFGYAAFGGLAEIVFVIYFLGKLGGALGVIFNKKLESANTVSHTSRGIYAGGNCESNVGGVDFFVSDSRQLYKLAQPRSFSAVENRQTGLYNSAVFRKQRNHIRHRTERRKIAEFFKHILARAAFKSAHKHIRNADSRIVAEFTK